MPQLPEQDGAGSAGPHCAPASNFQWRLECCEALPSLLSVQKQSQAGDAWGTTDNSWGSQTHKENDASQGNNAFDFSDLEQALNKSYQQQSMPASNSQQAEVITQPHGQQLQTTSCCSLSPDMAGPQLPGFYLHMAPEAVGASSSMSAEDQHIAELVTAYEEGNQQLGQLAIVAKESKANTSYAHGGEASQVLAQ
ncbi:MAG: hypothetical protein FRX49_00494 [Trebouxia sp. A1-2]|nr:MAG: hypothetical protein FRX49_00494 [Trebouxia sp. A1-2]